MEINLAAYQPVSTIDDYGYASSVIFFRGCDLDCWYCHNKKYCSGNTPIETKYVEEFLMRDDFLTSSITLSGGEPLLQLNACKHFIDVAHTLGKEICLYTNGNHPNELRQVIKGVQRIYIDFKSAMGFNSDEEYDKYASNVLRSITIASEYNCTVNVTYVACSITPDVMDEVEDIKACLDADIKFTVVQGVNINTPTITPLQMKAAFRNCYIRTREFGVEWNE